MNQNSAFGAIHTTHDMTTAQHKKGRGIVVSDAEIPAFIKSCYSLKPAELFLPELTWKFMVRNALRGENILLVGSAGCAKTMSAHCLVDALKRPFFNIPLGSTQDPRSALIGNTHFNKESGTYFSEAYFVNAIRTPNAIILLDELSRAHPEAWNILMPVLDKTQRYLRLEEKEDGATVPVAEGVSFVATANIGNEYTSTRVLDRALTDRFTIVEIACLEQAEEEQLLLKKYPNVDKRFIHAVSEVASHTRKVTKSEKSPLQTSISTRTSVTIGALLNDGFTLNECAEIAIYPFFSAEGGALSERTYMKQLIQKSFAIQDNDKPKEADEDKIFTDEEISNMAS